MYCNVKKAGKKLMFWVQSPKYIPYYTWFTGLSSWCQWKIQIMYMKRIECCIRKLLSFHDKTHSLFLINLKYVSKCKSMLCMSFDRVFLRCFVLMINCGELLIRVLVHLHTIPQINIISFSPLHWYWRNQWRLTGEKKKKKKTFSHLVDQN